VTCESDVEEVSALCLNWTPTPEYSHMKVFIVEGHARVVCVCSSAVVLFAAASVGPADQSHRSHSDTAE